MFMSMISFCGLDCSQCAAYIATKNNDEAAKVKVVEQWRKDYQCPDMPIAAATCDGCHPGGKSKRHGGYCHACPLRACGITKKVLSCAHCDDYDACQTLETFFNSLPAEASKGSRKTLQGLRKQVKG